MSESRALNHETLLLVLTASRLGLGAGLCASLWWHASPYTSVAWLVAVIIADIGDGVLARRLGVDTNGRHVLDAVVDRLTIHTTAALVMWMMPETIWLLTPVIVRDVVLILRNWWLLKAKRVIITPGNIHRTGTVLYAVLFATILFTTGPVAIWVSVVISAVVWFLLLDYLRAGNLVPSYPKGGGLYRYQARGLLALRGQVPPLIDNVASQAT